MRDRINIAKYCQSVGQQAQRPVLSPGGWRGAGQGEQVSFHFPIQLALSPAGRSALMQGCIQPFFNEALTDTMNGLATDIVSILDSLIGPSGALWTATSFEQDLGMGTHATRSGASADQFVKFNALISSQSYNVFSGLRIGYLQSTDLETISCWILPDPCLFTTSHLTHY